VDKMGRLSERKEFGVKMKKNGKDLWEIEGIDYGGFREREARKRERESSEEDEVRGKGKRRRGQIPRLRPVAVHHGPWRSPRTTRGVLCHSFFLVFSGLAPHGRISGVPNHGANFPLLSSCFFHI